MMMRIVLLVLVSTSSSFDFLEEPRRGCWWDYGSGERVKKCDHSALALALALAETAKEEVNYQKKNILQPVMLHHYHKQETIF